jgi:nucleoside-diphosphate-sugar epimerase
MISDLYNECIKTIVSHIDWKKEFYKKNVLIAGATGLIGTVLVDCLMEGNRHHELEMKIVILSRSEKNALNHFSKYWGDKDFLFIRGDVNQPLPEMGDFDYIIQAASNTHPVLYSTDPVGTIISNVIGTYHLLEYARTHDIQRFMYLSSVEIYGTGQENVNKFSETDCGYINCNTMRAGYPESKRTGESLCCAYAEKYGIDFVIPRLCRVYGPTMRSDDSKAIAQFIKKAVLKENIILKSNGEQEFSFLFVMDAVFALIWILQNGVKGEAYNVSSEHSDVCLKDLAEMLADIAGTKVVFELPEEIESRGYSKATRAVLNNSRLKQIGWKELFGIKQGLELTVNILKDLDAGASNGK